MDFMTLLSYALAVIETGALVVALIFITRGLHEKKNQQKKQGKKGGKSSEITQKVVAASYRNAGIFFVIYLLLNLIRNFGVLS